MEEWKSIEGFEDYEISSHGRLRKGDKPMKVHKNLHRRGVRFAMLWRDKKYHQRRISRLVATAFIPNPENKGDVDHIDLNQDNNRISNLRWATRSENLQNTKPRGKFPKGVHADPHWYGKFIASCADAKGKMIYLGGFDTPEAAKKAVDEFKFTIFGELYRP